MPDPSFLLLTACVHCLQGASEQAPSASVVCDAQRNLVTSAQTPEVLPSCESPELLVAAIESRSSDRPKLKADHPLHHTSEPQPIPSEPGILISWANHTRPSAADSSLRSGNYGRVVTNLQARLQQLGYDTGRIDGVYGYRTKEAVIRFQQARGLSTTGIVDPATWAELGIFPAAPEPSYISQAARQNLRIVPVEAVSHKTTAIAKTAWMFPSESLNGSTTFPDFPDYWYWIGWTLIYGMGWIIIFKESFKEVAGFQVVVVQNKRSIAPVANGSAAPKLNFNKTQPQVRTTAPKSNVSDRPTSKPASPEPHSTVATAPQTQPKDSKPEYPPLEVAWADNAQVQPLKNLFVGLDTSETNQLQRPTPPLPRKSIHQNIRLDPSTSETDPADETQIANLALNLPAGAGPYHYSLIDDAEGLFVLRGTELRIVNHRLNATESSTPKTITLRCTNGMGVSVDKSFQIDIRKSMEK
jgi:hypothetical protein